MAANVGLTDEWVFACIISAMIEGASERECAEAAGASRQGVGYALAAAKKEDAPQHMRDQMERLARAREHQRERVSDSLKVLTKAAVGARPRRTCGNRVQSEEVSITTAR